MKRTILLTALALAAGPAFATTCDDVKATIEAKLEKKGVKNYALDVVDAADKKEGRVVGTCEGGKKKIVYNRAKP